MTKNNKKNKNPFAASLDFFIRVSGTNNETVGDVVGYKKGKMIDAIRNGRSEGVEPKRRAIAEYFGKSYDEFLEVGQSIIDKTFDGHIIFPHPPITTQMPTQATRATSSPAPCQNCGGDIQNKKLEKHQELVGGFEFQDVAIDINQGLLILEKMMGRDGLLEIKGIVNQMIRVEEKKRGITTPANGTEGN